MAVLTASGIARVALPLLSREVVLPRLVTRVPVTGFAPPNGETVTVRVRQPRTAREQSSAGASITYDDQNEQGVEVTLKHLYDAYHVTDEDMSYSLEDFASQITEPQVKSVAVKAEDQIIAAINSESADATVEFALSATDADTKSTILAAREALSDAFVPAEGRFLAVAPDIATRILSLDILQKANEAGSASVLRDAVIGRLFGFTVVESPGLTDSTAFAAHRSSIVFATKQPSTPMGIPGNQVGSVTQDGMTLRQIFQYDPDVLSDASVLSTFAGATVVYEDPDDSAPADTERWVKIGTASS